MLVISYYGFSNFSVFEKSRIGTLSDYVINYPYVKVQKPAADIDEKKLKMYV